MNVMLSQVVDSIEYQIKDAGVEVVVNDLPSCQGDGVQINQVFSNLIGNALKFLDPPSTGENPDQRQRPGAPGHLLRGR